MSTTTPNYEIDPNDPKLTAVTTERDKTISDSNKDFNKIIANENKLYNDQLIAIEEYKNTQEGLQAQKHEHTLDLINQQKEQAKTDFQKEASAAYVDYQKQVNPYGAQAEQMAAMGLTNTGYSESSKVNMFNQYQIRFTAAREMYQKALLNYDNQITEAKLQNSSILAEIAQTTLEKEMEAIIAWTQRSSDLLIEKANRKLEIMSMYETKWQNVYDNLMDENKLAEEVRQFNATNSLQQQQLQIEKDKFEYQKQQDNAAKSGKTVVYRGRTNTPNGKKTSNKSAISRMNNNNVQPKSDSAVAYFNALIASGADKDRVSNEIAIALRNGEISKEEAANLRKRFTPRGVQY